MNKITSLTDLISQRTLEKIQDNFSEATGISCVMRNLKAERITGYSNPSHLWLEIIKHPEIESELKTNLLATMERCLKTSQTEIYQRYIDTYTFIVPVGIDGQVLAFLIGGLVRFGNPDIEICSTESKKLGIDLDNFLKMYLELPFVRKEKLESCANLFKIVATSLSNLAKEGTEAKAKIDQILSLNSSLTNEIKMASSNLRESEERYKNLFNTINDGIYITDLQGIIKDMNPAGARMIGYQSDELIGKMVKEIYVRPSDRDEFVKTLMKTGHIENFYPHIKLKNGQSKYFETNATVIRDQQGKIIGIQGIFRDISHRDHNPLHKSTNNVIARTAIKGSQNN